MSPGYGEMNRIIEPPLLIRAAVAADAGAATEVVRRSITELCRADHQDDPDTLERWLANKTPAYFRTWIERAENYCVVGELDQALAGVGLLHASGEIRLFYLAPGCQRRGLGRAIHAALERYALGLRLTRLDLCSTEGARAFYEALGYQACAPARELHGVLRCHPYSKSLSP